MFDAVTPAAWRWDVFCRVIDNHGDLGVCWRLACDLADRGQQLRLWVDDPAALRWMAPQGHPRVALLHWTEDTPLPEPGDVVVEAFGCDPPEAFVARMAAADRPPVWINLEYLSAEDYVERSHRLRSPQRCGLDKWFFYPGFTRPPAACCARMACWPSRPASTHPPGWPPRASRRAPASAWSACSATRRIASPPC
jgi:uncharacterized repeat protein (TIGR03837 family)